MYTVVHVYGMCIPGSLTLSQKCWTLVAVFLLEGERLSVTGHALRIPADKAVDRNVLVGWYIPPCLPSITKLRCIISYVVQGGLVPSCGAMQTLAFLANLFLERPVGLALDSHSKVQRGPPPFVAIRPRSLPPPLPWDC